MQSDCKSDATTITVAAYCRRSAERAEARADSLDVQLSAIRRRCDAQYGPEGYALAAFTDDGFSGTTTWRPGGRGRRRPALRELVEAVSDGRVHVLMVHSLDRLFRPSELHREFAEEVLKPNDVSLVVIGNDVEADGPPASRR
jgi:DNA invertase Pin-like site-specific DNA recombinase